MEYILLTSLITVVLAGAVELVTESAGTFLVDTGDDIGRPVSQLEFASPPTTTPEAPVWEEPPVTLGPNLVGEGSFEGAAVAPGGWAAVSLPPWQSTAGLLEVWDSGHNGVVSHEGERHAELNYNNITTYFQDVTLTPGALYEWTVAYRARVTPSEQAELLFDGNVIQTLTGSTSAWTVFSGRFTASTSTLTVALQSITAGGTGNLIDAIGVREVIVG